MLALHDGVPICGGGIFRVEEFKLPVMAGSLKVGAIDSKGALVAPSALNADVQIAYVSGGPAGQLPVSLSAVERDKSLRFMDYDDYSFIDRKSTRLNSRPYCASRIPSSA